MFFFSFLFFISVDYEYAEITLRRVGTDRRGDASLKQPPCVSAAPSGSASRLIRLTQVRDGNNNNNIRDDSGEAACITLRTGAKAYDDVIIYTKTKRRRAPRPRHFPLRFLIRF